MSAKAGIGDEYLKDEIHKINELESGSMATLGE